MKCVVLAFVIFMLFACMNCEGNAVANSGNGNGYYVRDACSVTLYRSICVYTLAPYSNYAKHNHRRWAEAAVMVTVGGAKNVSGFLSALKGRIHYRRRQQLALSDCIQSIGETLDNLYDSLDELRNLEASTFELQMQNVETWISAALTNEDTCLDGFSGRKGEEVKKIRHRLTKLSHITSNALALVTKLASDHQRSFISP